MLVMAMFLAILQVAYQPTAEEAPLSRSIFQSPSTEKTKSEENVR